MSEDKIIIHMERGMEELIPMFFEESENEIESLKTALSSDDMKTIKMIGHRIKGSSASYGFEGMSRIGKALEDAVANQLTVAEIQKLVDQLIHYLRQVDIVYDR